MHLILRPNNKVRYLYLIESTYSSERRTTIKKVVKNLGRFDALPEAVVAIYNDPEQRQLLAAKAEELYRKQQLQAPNTEAQASSKTRLDKTKERQDFLMAVLHEYNNEIQRKAVENSTQKDSHFNRSLLLRYGHLLLRKIWRDELGLTYKIDYLQEKKSEISTWRINDLLFYICALKLIDPQSYYSACSQKSNFLYCPWNSIAQDNFYRGLDFVYEHREELIKHADKQHQKKINTEVKLAFFDCTNTWFETPYDDVFWQQKQITRQVVKNLVKDKLMPEQIEAFLQSEQFTKILNDEMKARQDEILRMKGNSKEGRYSQPIVTVALAIDQTGFPIDCKVFPGNMSEVKTIEPVINSLKEKYNVSGIYFVADRGLNSTATLDALQKQKQGFVVAQKVSMQKPAVRAEMLSTEGYRNYRINATGDFVPLEGELREETARFKVREFTKESRVEDSNGGLTRKGNKKRKLIRVKCRIIYTFSPERKIRDLAQLEEKIAKASKAVQENRLMGNGNASGWRALIKTKKEVAQGKAEKDMYRAQGLKENVIAEHKEIAGYSAIVYFHPCMEDDEKPVEKLDPTQVLSTYHKLVNIEDCFRVMKSNFSIRPVYVRLHTRITAHCYLCVIALMMLRTLQEKLSSIGVQMSSWRICNALRDALLLPLPSEDGIQGFFNVGLNEVFHTPDRTGKLGKMQSDANELVDNKVVWSKFEKERTSTASDTDLIMQAVGLSPLRYFSSMRQIKKHFGLHNLPDASIVALEHVEYNKRLAASDAWK